MQEPIDRFPENHPAHQDLDESDAFRILNPGGGGNFEKDNITGKLDITDFEPDPILPKEIIEASSIVQAVRRIRAGDRSFKLTPERKVAKLLALLNDCRTDNDDSFQFALEEEPNRFAYDLHRYEIGAIRRALNETVPFLENPERVLLSVLAKGDVERNHGVVFEVLIRSKCFSLAGVSVAETLLPLLSAADSSTGLFDYIQACSDFALKLLPELFCMKDEEKRSLGGSIKSCNGFHVDSCINTICKATGKASVPYLRDALTASKIGSRAAALEQLRKHELASELEDEVARTLDDSEKAMVKEALLTMAHLGPGGAKYTARVLALAESSGEAIRAACMYFLGKVGEPVSRVKSAFTDYFEIVSDTLPVPEDNLDIDSPGILPSATRIDISAAIADFKGFDSADETGSHLDNVSIYLAGLAAFISRDSSAIELFENAWQHESWSVRQRFLEALPHTQNFEFAKPFILKSINSGENNYETAIVLLRFGTEGLDFMGNWIAEKRREISETTDQESVERMESLLAGPERLYEINHHRRDELDLDDVI